ncbi:MAG: hypothetical protein GF365_03195 [Candidatus Buchananbacteria bacterium]|nr:hypothetical protein [Candidatus Buchananbacteria bacterium]
MGNEVKRNLCQNPKCKKPNPVGETVCCYCGSESKITVIGYARDPQETEKTEQEIMSANNNGNRIIPL